MAPVDHKNMESASTFLISSNLSTVMILHTHQMLLDHLESHLSAHVGFEINLEQIKTLLPCFDRASPFLKLSPCLKK